MKENLTAELAKKQLHDLNTSRSLTDSTKVTMYLVLSLLQICKTQHSAAKEFQCQKYPNSWKKPKVRDEDESNMGKIFNGCGTYNEAFKILERDETNRNLPFSLEMFSLSEKN